MILRLVAVAAGMLVSSANLPAQTAEQVSAKSPGDTVRVCALSDGQLREIAAEIDPATGDTIVNGQPVGDIHPPSAPPYLTGEEWYRADGMVVFQDRRYIRYGIPRVIRAHALTRVGEFRGIPLFAENRRSAARFVYALVSPACDFQPYWYAATVGEVLGR